MNCRMCRRTLRRAVRSFSRHFVAKQHFISARNQTCEHPEHVEQVSTASCFRSNIEMDHGLRRNKPYKPQTSRTMDQKKKTIVDLKNMSLAVGTPQRSDTSLCRVFKPSQAPHFQPQRSVTPLFCVAIQETPSEQGSRPIKPR